MLAKKEVYANHTDQREEHLIDDMNADDNKLTELTDMHTKPNKDKLTESTERITGISFKCKRCGHEWNYKGKRERAQCPRCRTDIKVIR